MLERRYAELQQAGGRRLEGIAVRYGDTASLPWGVRERIEPGAFAPLGDIVLNVQHDRGRPLARTGGGGLVLEDGADALTLAAELPETREADDTLALVRNGVLRGLSVEFRALEERLDSGIRVIERARLAAVGVVDSPAYPQSEVEARRRRGPRRTWVRGGIEYGIAVHCECLTGECSRVYFRPKALRQVEGREVLAIAGRASEAVGSTRGGTLRLRDTPERLEFEIDAAGRDTAAGRTIDDLRTAGVDIFARPLLDDAASEFADADGVRTYTRAAVRAVLLKPIAGELERRQGWQPIRFEGQEPTRRRARIWL